MLLLPTLNDQTLRLLPNAAGAYILHIVVKADVALVQRQFAGKVIKHGTYFYCGSARGPGGLAARVKRHCASDKKPHWHIDALTIMPVGKVMSVLAVPDGNECDLCCWLREKFLLAVPVPGFGSSDCAVCPAHLLAVPGGPLMAVNILNSIKNTASV
jgi:Uri superfamily endonuclease